VRRMGPVDEAGRGRPGISPLGDWGGQAGARLLLRVGACADELRLIGGERKVWPPDLVDASGGLSSSA